MKHGRINIYTKRERKMLSDIRDLRKKRALMSAIEIKDMKRTREWSRCGKLFRAYLSLLVEVVISHSDSVCYILMLVSMMKNAGLISLLYPMVVFGYALMEEVNPRKKVWYMLMIYTEALILAKFIFQLSFWDAIIKPEIFKKFQDTLVSRFGVSLATRTHTTLALCV